MDNEGYTSDVQDQAGGGEYQEENAPMDIAAAFQLVRENNKKATEPSDPEGDGAEGAQDSGSYGREEGGAQDDFLDDEPQASHDAPEPEPARYAGGPSARVQGDQYRLARNEILREIQNQARENVTREFREHDVKDKWVIRDIWERTEDGTVIFNNPDNPREPFRTRKEADDWIKAMNNQIDEERQGEIIREQQRLIKQTTPALRLLEFAPVYDSMPENVQVIFDKLIEPYSSYNADGEVVGFDTNLYEKHAQAVELAGLVGGGQAQQQRQPRKQGRQRQSGPAMDMKTGSGSSADDAEPRTLEEAMLQISRKKRGKANG